MSAPARERSLARAFRPSGGWLLAAGLLLGHQVLQRGLGVQVPFVDDYLDPVLAVPVLVGLARAEHRYVFGEAWRGFGPWELAGLTLGIALVGELVFPWLDPAGQTYDGWDFVGYGVGGVLSWGWGEVFGGG